MTNKELEAKVSQLTELVTNLVEQLPQKKDETVVTNTPAEPLDKVDRILGGTSDPIPSDYREAVNEILNSKFGIHVQAQKGIPAFKFTVLVPLDYTRENPDVRPKVISYSDGTNGVRNWCDLVLGSFDADIKQRIIADRTVMNS